MGKKFSDDVCLANYKKLCAFFNEVIDDASRFTVVYACGLDVGLMDYGIMRKTTYTYTSYAIGFDANANEIVILPIDRDMQSHGQPIYQKQSDIISAKQSWWSKEITIKDSRLPRKYIQFSVTDMINEDDDEVVIVIKQIEAYQQFIGFFKNKFSKK